jgi:glycosyltransferase involved in cell wall biosynthesis
VHQQSTYLPRASQTKVVLTIHDLNFLEKYRDQPRKIAYHTAALQRLVNRASGISFISEYTRSVAVQQLSISGNIPQKVIHNGCPLPTMVQPLRPNGVSDAPFLFSIGIVQPKKNVEVLLPLLAQLPNYQLIIAGNANTPYAAVLRRMAQELGVSHRFTLLGTVSEAEKAWLLQQMSALVFPSLQEGFGLPVIEAMHYGKPVFLSDCTSLPEVGGTEAYYWRNFAPASMREIFLAGMAAVAADAEKATRIRAWAAQFTWERAAQQYIELYAAAASL